MPIEEKKEVEKQIEDKKKEKPPVWKSLPPGIILIAGIILLLIFMGMGKSENKAQYIWIIIIVGLILYFLAKTKAPETGILSPREAELHVERDCLRKQMWGQFPIMSHFKVGPTIDMMHRDGRGKYYNVQVGLYDPYIVTKHFISKVMAIGDEKSFVTLVDSIGQFDGKVPQEVDIVHMAPWMRQTRKNPFLEKLWLGRGGGY